jgi:hypothetical protein
MGYPQINVDEKYLQAAMVTSSQADHTLYEEHLTRVAKKLKANDRIHYTFQG